MRTRYALALVLASAALAEPQAVFITLGVKDRESTLYEGRAEVEPGQVIDAVGWLTEKNERVDRDGSFAIRSDGLPPARGGQSRAQANGLQVTVDAPPNATFTLTVNGEQWTGSLADLTIGKQVLAFDGAVALAGAPHYATLLDDAGREDDYPSACSLPNGDQVAVWQSWSEVDGLDRLYVARRSGGAWGPAQQVPGVLGDCYRPQVTPDADGFCLVWTEMVDDDYELRTIRFAGGNWSTISLVAQRPGHDTHVALTTTPDGAIYAVWRGINGNSADIFMAVRSGPRWSAPILVDDSPANEWAPAIASGPAGVWTAWDSYLHGSYDVFAARLTPTGPAERLVIAASPRFEAGADVACAPDGTVWFSYQDAGADWGKATGRTVPVELRGQPLYRERNVKLVALRGGQLFEAPDPATVVTGPKTFVEDPQIACDAMGRLFLAYRQPLTVPRARGTKTFGERVWETYLTQLTPAGWAAPVYFPVKMARSDTTPALAPLSDGVTVVFHTDGREQPDIRAMQANRVFATTLAPLGSAGAPDLVVRPPVEPEPVHLAEAEALRLVRNRTLTVGGETLHLVRGDTHRHTEVSWDGTGDGTIYDSYRYAADAAGLDFYLPTDHNQRTGVDLPYIRWRCYKLVDIFHNPGVFTTLFGYERSMGYPNGHRNIIQATRGIESFKMIGGMTDLPQLYQYADLTDSLLIAHTTGTNHGTNWYDFNRALEPVVEIFQGCRMSYEYEGAPKSSTPGDSQAMDTGYRPQGFLWRAWQRGFKMGIISSSDHGSTHYSFAAVWTKAKDRAGIMDGLYRRHTYGSNDHILVEVTCGDRMMGDEWSQTEAPRLSINVVGTAELKQVDIIRDYEFVYTAEPNGKTWQFDWVDNQFTPGEHLYYVRVQQEDTSLAWASPMWITRPQ